MSIDQKAREIAVNIPLGSRALCDEREEAARLGIIEGRRQAFEEAAKVADDLADKWKKRGSVHETPLRYAAKKIRSLK